MERLTAIARAQGRLSVSGVPEGYDAFIAAEAAKRAKALVLFVSADDARAASALEAARFCAAAGVQAWELFDGTDEGFGERLSGRMLGVLPRCREPGVRAGTAGPAATDVTRQLVADLYQQGAVEMAAT